MSYQGTKWAQKVRGCNRGEKAILMQLGAEQDQRTNLIRMSVGELSLASDMNERQVRRILQQLEIKHVIKQIGGGLGKGNKSIYSFVSFAITKADILESQKRTLATAKADILDTKSGHSGQRNKEVIRTSEELQEEIQEVSSSTSDDDTFVKLSLQPDPDLLRVIQAFEDSPVTTGKVKPSDRVMAYQLLNQYSVEQIEFGILLASARRTATETNNGQSSDVQTLAYFKQAIAEAASDHNFSPSYAAHLKQWLTRHQNRNTLARKAPQSA